MVWIGFSWFRILSCCESGNEPMDSGFSQYLSNCQRFTDSPSPWSQVIPVGLTKPFYSLAVGHIEIWNFSKTALYSHTNAQELLPTWVQVYTCWAGAGLAELLSVPSFCIYRLFKSWLQKLDHITCQSTFSFQCRASQWLSSITHTFLSLHLLTLLNYSTVNCFFSRYCSLYPYEKTSVYCTKLSVLNFSISQRAQRSAVPVLYTLSKRSSHIVQNTVSLEGLCLKTVAKNTYHQN